MVVLKCSPLSKSQDMGRDLQEHLGCPLDHQETIQSFSRPLSLLLDQDNLLAHLVDPPLASQQHNFSQVQNRGG
jgi:hypothetical protein